MLFLLVIIGKTVHSQTLFLPGTKAYTISQRNMIMGHNDGYQSTAIGGDFFLYGKKDYSSVNGYLRDVHYLQEIRPGSDKTVRNTKKVYVDSLSGFYRYEDEYIRSLPTSRKPILGIFYTQEANFLQYDSKLTSLRINPMLNLSYGRNTTQSNESIFSNQRGVEFYGLIDNRLYFYTNVLESQSNFLPHIENRIRKYKAIPGQGLYKGFNSGLVESFKGWDYLNAQGFIGYKLVPSVAIELGHGKHFIGDGIRSLFLSDYAHNNFYLKLRAKFWRLNYQTLFKELSPFSRGQNGVDGLLPKKFSATHYLTFHLTKDIELGLFESVVFNRDKYFEFQYLNPVILYRAVEHFLGSPDNALVGLSARVNLLNTAQVYGQLVLDEFKLSELKTNTGWWANKYGYQAGIKYLNALRIPHLDLQYEYNQVRPYTYSHRGSVSDELRQSFSSYTHYNQPLAHPLGANFKEHLIRVTYRPFEKLTLNGDVLLAYTGLDTDDVSYGQDVLVSTDYKQGESGNTLLQGDYTRIHQYDITASYEVIYNLVLEANVNLRNQRSESRKNDFKSSYFGVGLRYNVARRKNDY